MSERVRETGQLLQEKKKVRRDVVLGRGLLEVHERVEELEERLGIRTREDAEDEVDDLDAEEDDASSPELEQSSTSRRLQKQTDQYVTITTQVDKLGSSHPFLASLQSRLAEIRRTILLDLSAALRQAKTAGDKVSILGLGQMFGSLDAERDALKVLKGG